MRLKTLGIGLLLTLIAVGIGPQSYGEGRDRAQGLATWKVVPLAKAYGYVRFFHPTAAASEVNWDKFLVYAINRLSQVTDQSELLASLRESFAPLGSQLEFSLSPSPTRSDLCTEPSEPYYINQHQGVALNKTPNPDPAFPIYASRRVLVVKGVPENPLFGEVAPCGMTLSRELGEGLYIHLPLALPARLDQSLGPWPEVDCVDFSTLSPDNAALRIADVVTIWDIMQHFYPYFDVVAVDWSKALTVYVEAALKAHDKFDHFHVLRHLVALLDDGHGAVYVPKLYPKVQAGLPALLAMIEGKVTVERSFSNELSAGDVINKINGRVAADELRQIKAELSGSDQWRTFRALRASSGFGWGDLGSSIDLEVERDGQTQIVRSQRSYNGDANADFDREDFFEADEGIFYVNLDKVEMPVLEAHIQELAAARGVVFDLRGYPAGNHEIIRHLIDSPVLSAHFNIPLTLFPDQQPAPDFDRQGRWLLEPLPPKLRGRIVFLTDGRAISYAESLLGIVDAYHLGDLVATSNTAGANGNVNATALPSGAEIRFTGMQVIRHDGGIHHMIGIAPKIRVARTLQAVKAGRDELLERALRLIDSGQ